MIYISIYAVLISRQQSPQVANISISLLRQTALDVHFKQSLQALLWVHLEELWKFDCLSEHIVDVANVVWTIGAAVYLDDPRKHSIFDERRKVFGTVAQEIADGGNGVEKEMVVFIIEALKQVLDDLLDVIDEFLTMEGDITNSVDGVLQDSLVLVELANALQDAADYLIFLELLIGLIVVL